MRFHVVGEKGNPVIVMLTGSFCPGECLEYLYSNLPGYQIIIPTYNGHYEGAKDFTTRKNEAREICDYVTGLHISRVHMLYGQSMGTEVGMELYTQLAAVGISVGSLFFDGAPMIRLSAAYKAFMRFKFASMLSLCRKKSVDEFMNMKFLKQFAGDKLGTLRPMIESMAAVAPYLSKISLHNEVECCYTFDYPPLDEYMQRSTHFFYGEDEKAYKTCIKKVRQAYPLANYHIEKGHGHMTYSCEHTGEYIALLKEIVKKTL